MSLTPRERAHRGEQRPLFVPDAGTSKDLRDFKPLGAGRKCHMCDGRELAMEPIGEECLRLLVQEEIGRMAREGELDEVMQRVLDRRLARGGIPPEDAGDHEIVDVPAVPYMGVD